MTEFHFSRRAALGGGAAATAALAAGVTLGAATAAFGQTTLRKRVDVTDPVTAPPPRRITAPPSRR